MKISYNKLWKLLIDRDLSKKELGKRCKISDSTLTRMSNNEYINLKFLVNICVELDCLLDDIVEIIKLEV